MKKRADGRYCKQIVIGHDENGKKIIKTLYSKSKSELERMAAEAVTQRGLGLDLGNDLSYNEWADLFLSGENKRLTKSEYLTKKARIQPFCDGVAKLPIKAIKPCEIEAILADIAEHNPRTGRPTSEKTLRAYVLNCSQVFKFATKNRAIAYNPCDHVQMPMAKPKKERRALSPEERKRLDSLECEGRLGVMLCTYAGLCKGEMAALRWEDVDLNNRTIHVYKSWDFKTKKLKSTKTKSGTRLLPITDKLYEELKPHAQKTGLVITCKGKQLTDALADRLLTDALVELNQKFGNPDLPPIKVGSKYERLITIEPFGWHDLRHTFCSLLYQSDVDLYSAMQLMGHSNVQTTLAVYTHLQQEQKVQSIAKLNDFLSGQSTDSQPERKVVGM